MDCVKTARTCRSAASPRKRSKRWSRIVAVVLFIACGLVIKAAASSLTFFEVDVPSFTSRHLLSTVEWEKCDFEIGHTRNYSAPDSWTTVKTGYAWAALYFAGILWIFIALAIICDDFFVPSLEAISEKLDLSEDVAGATFMAAGSSAPELFTSVAGVTVESDVGVGTIVGSAVFNLLVIIALTAAFSTQALHLDWRPMLRDGVSYALSIGFFILFAWDGVFEFYEALILLILYLLYIVLMKFNPRLMDFLAEIGPKGGQVSPHRTEVRTTSDAESLVTEPEVTTLQGSHGTPAGKLPPLKKEEGGRGSDEAIEHVPGRRFSHVHKGELASSFIHTRRGSSAHCEHIRIKSVAQGQIQREMRKQSTFCHQAPIAVTPVMPLDANGNATNVDNKGSRPQSAEVRIIDNNQLEEDDEPKIRVCPCLPGIAAETPEYPSEKRICLSPTKFILSWILFILGFPFMCLFTWTIPDCSKPHNRKFFLVSFFASIIWIAILSFGMVTLVGRSGCILGVDKFTMGLVVIAIGTSVPDALSSILVARDGFGDMAVSNAIGSNVFDIDLGLGLPFVIRILIDKMKPIYMLSDTEQELFSSGEIIMVSHVKFGFLLLLILLIAILLVVMFKFQLSRKLGASFVVLYILFVAYAYIQDLYCNYDC
ncbi:sodium/potassium/calcium exchanger 1 isoform X2 [Exaiptasia diaphana]|uniref:Sodium/calcium exchanger membrane region domain-containing protein n=1 Tax=Exaiptasia diaphana TaxID=2652724 RepID=A0A913YH89_EXADI|nr:sodium/potassium/calcium exchanger 1 isoform X2 [Exaiptasia diaphana]